LPQGRKGRLEEAEEAYSYLFAELQTLRYVDFIDTAVIKEP